MYCKKCGAQIDDDSVFCQNCGEKQADAFDTSKEDNSESSETGKIEVGTMLYVIKPDINLPQVGYKVRVTKKVIVDGKEQIIAQGPYKPDGTPVSKVRTMYAIDLSKFSTSPPSQEVVKKGNTNRRRSMFLMISAAFTIVIIIGLIYFGFSSGGNGGGSEIKKQCETYYRNGWGERRQCPNAALDNGRYCKQHTCKIDGCYNQAWEYSGTCDEHNHLR